MTVQSSHPHYDMIKPIWYWNIIKADVVFQTDFLYSTDHRFEQNLLELE